MSDPIDQLMEDMPPASEPATTSVTEYSSGLAQQPDTEPENVQDMDMSTGTIADKTAGRPGLEKRGRGRPPKRSKSSQSVAEEPEQRRSSGIPVQIEVQIESNRAREQISTSHGAPGKIARKPVPPTEPTSTSTSSPSPATTTPELSPAKTEKALPSAPPQLAARLPQPPATPRAHTTPSASAKQATISPSQSPQSSDAENQPPSSKPAASAAPKRTVLAPVAATPMRGSPSKRNAVAGLQSTLAWAAIDLEVVFSPGGAGERGNGVDRLLRKGAELTSPEKRMTVEEWIYHNAGLAEQKLKHECETMVSAFEKEGSRAMRVLEGLVVE